MQMFAPPFIVEHKRKGKRADGVRYEKKVHREFLERYPGYLPSAWFEYTDAEGRKWCQPDGLIFDPWRGRLTIIEVKYQHTEKAWEQLFQLYLPVCSALFAGTYQLACVEVCRWFDCATLCPETPSMCDEPNRARPGRFNVHIFRS
jgi:hypothetical protein